MIEDFDKRQQEYAKKQEIQRKKLNDKYTFKPLGPILHNNRPKTGRPTSRVRTPIEDRSQDNMNTNDGEFDKNQS